jgi:hypothetical protein
MRRLLAVIIVLSAWAVAACGAILGIEHFPVDDGTDAAQDRGTDDASADAAEPCVENLALGCQASCPHAFCDDFDHDDAGVGARWVSPYTPSGGPLVRLASGGEAHAVRAASAASPPFGYEARVTSDAGSSYVFIAHRVDKHAPGPGFAGLRYRFQTAVGALDLSTEGGPVPDAGAAMVAMLGPSPFGSPVFAIVMLPSGFYLVIGADPTLRQINASITEIATTDLKSFGDQPFVFDVFVTTRARAIAENLTSCAAVTDPTVIAVRVNNFANGCAALKAELADLAWTQEPMIALGVGAWTNGTARLVHDNAILDFLE